MDSPNFANADRWTAIAVAALNIAFWASAHLFFLSRVFGATTVFNSESFLFWRFSFCYGFRLDTDFKIETPALPTHIEQYSFINY